MFTKRFSRSTALRTLAFGATIAAASACSSSDDTSMPPAGGDEPVTFTVTIANIAVEHAHLASGAQAIPAAAADPGPLFPGDVYELSFHAGPEQRLSFALMFVQSNDWFYAPGEDGIALFDEAGEPIEGDITELVHLWDAGTEADQEPGLGSEQAPRQSGANMGAVDPDNTVRMAVDAHGNLPAKEDVLKVTLHSEEGNRFTLRIENVSTEQTLALSDNTTTAVPLAPVVFALHTEPGPLFTMGVADRGEGLEALAEDGNPESVVMVLAQRTGLTSPLAPGAYAVHLPGAVLVLEGESAAGTGLEALSEDGDPSALAEELAQSELVLSSGVYNVVDGMSEPGPLFPGQSYSFVVEARVGEYLSFANMLVQSNDFFIAPGANGIPLFDAESMPRSGDMTMAMQLWNAGTEAEQAPGAGADQAPRQSGANMGAAENGVIEQVADAAWPSAETVVRVTLTPTL